MKKSCFKLFFFIIKKIKTFYYYHFLSAPLLSHTFRHHLTLTIIIIVIIIINGSRVGAKEQKQSEDLFAIPCFEEPPIHSSTYSGHLILIPKIHPVPMKSTLLISIENEFLSKMFICFFLFVLLFLFLLSFSVLGMNRREVKERMKEKRNLWKGQENIEIHLNLVTLVSFYLFKY